MPQKENIMRSIKEHSKGAMAWKSPNCSTSGAFDFSSVSFQPQLQNGVSEIIPVTDEIQKGRGERICYIDSHKEMTLQTNGSASTRYATEMMRKIHPLTIPSTKQGLSHKQKIPSYQGLTHNKSSLPVRPSSQQDLLSIRHS